MQDHRRSFKRGQETCRAIAGEGAWLAEERRQSLRWEAGGEPAQGSQLQTLWAAAKMAAARGAGRGRGRAWAAASAGLGMDQRCLAPRREESSSDREDGGVL